MCFKSLPIDFDEAGQPFLKPGVANPYAYETRSQKNGAALAVNQAA